MEEAKVKSETGSVQVSSPQKSNVKNTQNEDGRKNVEVTWNVDCDVSSKSIKDIKTAPTHSKKVIKHALRQQAKRRRKNTTIAAGNSAPIQRISLSPHCEIEEISNETACYRQPTMAEVLASIPGFSVKPRKRSNKKLSAAAQIEQTKEGCIDLETPDSILVNSNLRSLLNKHTFHSLPPLYQYKLLQLLPHVDRVPFQSESMFRLSNSGLNNEFFARACLDWRERLAEGEFTVENQAKLKAEQEKEKSKLDPWKLKHFEPMWGESLREWPSLPPGILATAPNSTPKVAATNPPVTNSFATKIGNDVKTKQVKAVAKTNAQNEQKTPPPILRTVGAVTRAVTSYREKRLAEESSTNQVRPNKRNRQQEDTSKEEEKEKVEEPEKTANDSEETILETVQEENRVNEESDKQNDDLSFEESPNVSEENMNEVVVISTDDIQKEETDDIETNLDKIEEDQIQIVEFEQNIVEEVVRNVVEEVIQMKEDAVDSFKDLDDQTAEEEKTLGDLVALEEEVADRIELSVKAEALQKASLEEWEIIKVDPNQEGESSSGLPTPGGSNEIMASTSSEDSNKNHNYYNDILYQETLKEDEAALLAAAWDVVGSSSEFQSVNLNQPVSVIPCQEELEVRLQESSLPVPQWDYSSSENKQSHGHVKLELEVTLTPEVDSQVSSTVEQLPSIGNLTNSESCSPVVSSGETGTRTSIPLIVEDTRTSLSTETVMIQQAPHVNVIPPTTIVCLPPPPLFSTQATPAAPPIRPPQNHNSSSSALPFIALTTSTPVRALSTKTVSKGATGTNRGGGGRNSNKPPPGAVNLERSYQICQAVIQNSPNRHQLRCQLKPPPSLLIQKSSSTTGSSNTNSRVTSGNSSNIRQVVRQGVRQTQQHQVLLKHVFTSSHGIPVNMAVLPSQHNQMGEYMMVQRGVQVRRSNSAPPSNMEPGATSGLAHRGGRPASVGGPRPPSSESAPPPPPPPLPAPPLPPSFVLPPSRPTSTKFYLMPVLAQSNDCMYQMRCLLSRRLHHTAFPTLHHL